MNPRIQEIEARKAAIRALLEGNSEVDLTALETELRTLNDEKTNIERRASVAAGIQAGTIQARAIETPAATPAAAPAADRFASAEYRNAFMNFAKTGVMAPEFSGQEFRANASTAVADASAVVPTTIMDEIIKKLYTTGQIFSRIRKLNIKGGVSVPILSLKPVAAWIGEAATSDRQKVTANTNVTFTYYGLECKVATSLLAETVTLSSFESTIIGLIVEAMAKAIDLAIIKGTGSGQPLGILVDPRVVAGQTVTMSIASNDISNWAKWQTKVMAKIPLSYRAGGVFIMASGTFDGSILGMVGTDGQPIGRINYGITEGAQERFAGKEVILVEDDVIKPVGVAVATDVVAIFCRLDDYAINSNMQMQMYRWLDHDTNQWIDKAILVADGKLIDPDGVIIVKLAA